jgi:hypothetical protein
MQLYREPGSKEHRASCSRSMQEALCCVRTYSGLCYFSFEVLASVISLSIRPGMAMFFMKAQLPASSK